MPIFMAGTWFFAVMIHIISTRFPALFPTVITENVCKNLLWLAAKIVYSLDYTFYYINFDLFYVVFLDLYYM